MPPLSTLVTDLILLASALVLAWAAVGDMVNYRIPNIIPALVAGGFAALAWFEPPAFLTGGAATGVIVLAAGAVLFAWRLVGGGDVKLLAATSLWCGSSQLTPFALVTAISAVVLALVMLSPLRQLLPPPPARLSERGGAGAISQPMPFGVAVAVAGVWLVSQYIVIPR